jgi:amidase
MSVFSLDVSSDNPVTVKDLDRACEILGVTIKDEEKAEYVNLLAVYHDSMAKLMAAEDYTPELDHDRFERKNVHFPSPDENSHGAWAWKCDIRDSKPNPSSLLYGKTVALKDCIAVGGLPLLLGTNFFSDYTPSTDATIVTRMLKHGAIVAGKSVCENLCHSATSHTAATGVVHNPYAKGYASGGSSSGSAVLVSLGPDLGGCDYAIGADQGGSIRVPAAWCGIVGFKPTFGMVPWTGAGSNEPTNDHMGPMTRDVLSNARLLKAIAGTDFVDDRSYGAPAPEQIPAYHEILQQYPDPKDLSGMRIGILTEGLNTPALDPRVKTTFLAAAERFKSLGATVEEVSVPTHSTAGAVWTGISKLGGYLNKTGAFGGRRGYQLNELNQKLWPMTQEKWNNAIPSTKNIYLNGVYAQDMQNFPGIHGKATNLSLKARHGYDAVLGDWSAISTFVTEANLERLKQQKTFDVLITPTLPFLAKSHPDLGDAGVTGNPILQLQKQIGLTGNTAPFNQTGHPALAMPIGMLNIEEGPLKGSGTKLPVSLQIIGKWWDEVTVLKVAYAWETAAGGPDAWKQL